jgi:hypothetical protein
VDTVRQNPDAIQQVPAEIKPVVGAMYVAQTGNPVPAVLPGEIKSQAENSQVALSHIANVRRLLNDPDVQGAIGPILGRLGNLEQGVGTTIGKTPQQVQKEQEFRTALQYLFFREGKSLFGGRPPEELMKNLEKASANVGMQKDMILGSLNAAEGSAQRTIQSARDYQFGGAQAGGSGPTTGSKVPPGGAPPQQQPNSGRVNIPKGAVTVSAGGKTYYFNNQAAADAFKKKAGLQ